MAVFPASVTVKFVASRFTGRPVPLSANVPPIEFTVTPPAPSKVKAPETVVKSDASPPPNDNDPPASI